MSGPMTEPREALAARAKEIERTTRHNFSSEGRLAHEAALIAINLAAGVDEGRSAPSLDEGLRAAAHDLANEAARAVTEPRRFHQNEEYRQQALGAAISAVRRRRAQEGETP